jgi:hypothetical protein
MPEEEGMHTMWIIGIILMIAALAIFGFFFGSRLVSGGAQVGESKVFLEQCARWQLRGCGTDALSGIDAELVATGQVTLTDMCKKNFPKIPTTSTITEIEHCQDVCKNGCNPAVQADLTMQFDPTMGTIDWSCNKESSGTFTVKSWIWNFGTATAEKIEVYIGDGGTLGKTVTISKLRPKEKSPVVTPININVATVADAHKLYVEIDPNKNIAESNEDNNRFPAPAILCGVS